jgi:membrane-associated phospholipid phosphatase
MANRGRLILFLLLCSSTARAQNRNPLEYNLSVDLPTTLIAAGAFLGGYGVQGVVINAPVCNPCDPNKLISWLDRPFAGSSNRAADYTSDGFLGAAVALPLVLDAIDVATDKSYYTPDERGKARADWGIFRVDFGLWGEVIAVDMALNQVVKMAVRRPRPFVYSPTVNPDCLKEGESFVSFYSEHSSLAFAAAAFYTTVYALRHPDRRGRAAAVGGSLFGLATMTAMLRVVAGKHFPSDVIAGALIGTGIGAGIPLLHRRAHHLPLPQIAPVPGGAMVTFAFLN